MGSVKMNRIQNRSKSAISDAPTRFLNLDISHESPMNGDFDTTGKICVTDALTSLCCKEDNRCDKPYKDSICAPPGISRNKTFCGIQQSSISDIQSLFDFCDMPPIANCTEFNISCSNCPSSSKSNADIDHRLEDLLSSLSLKHEINSTTSINRSSFPVSTNVKSPSDDSCLSDLLELDFCFKEPTVHKRPGSDKSDFTSDQPLQFCENEDEQIKSLSTLAENYFPGKDVAEVASDFEQENMFSLISAENKNSTSHEVCSKNSFSLCNEDIEPSLSALAMNYLSLNSENLNFPSLKNDPNGKLDNLSLSSTESFENLTIFDTQKKEEAFENVKFDFLLSCPRNKNIPTKMKEFDFLNNDLDQEETTKILNISSSKRNRTESDEGYFSEKFSPEVNLSDCIKGGKSLSSDTKIPPDDCESIHFSNILSETIQNPNKLKNTYYETPILNTALQESHPAVFKLQPLNANSKQSLFARALSCKLKQNSDAAETVCKIKTELFNTYFCPTKIHIDLPEPSNENISDKSSHCVVISNRLHYPHVSQ